MVVCCVPNCGTDSWKCDPSITFHDFPSNPDLAAKWIKQINTAVKTRPMWFPRGRPVICSKHFLETDFRGDTDALRPRSIPTVFGYKYIGQNPEAYTCEINKLNDKKKSPLIVKVLKPQDNAVQSGSGLLISNVHSQAVCNGHEVERDSAEFNGTKAINTYASAFQNAKAVNKEGGINNCASWTFKSNTIQDKSKLGTNGMTIKTTPKRNINFQTNHLLQKHVHKKQKNNSDLIEIGPNTFLKINPDIIKVNKKLTPSGNTVLQFLMDEKLAKSQSADLFPKLVQGTSATMENCSNVPDESTSNQQNGNVNCDQQQNKAVHHVLGHLVDTHVCTETCDLALPEEEILKECNQNTEVQNLNKSTPDQISNANQHSSNNVINESCNNSTDASFIEKAPVLLTTNMPLSHCLMDKSKYQLTLKQKNRQIASLKFKISNLQKKVEELEDRCIVQERQLSYSFIKRLKTIRKNASKGDPSATYILEQIRSYTTSNSKMRWSDSTLTQCAVWCRKAPYAYEYFKKADFFKLPCLGTVKRFMKKHPEIKFQKKKNSDIPGDDGSSSDFDFDESDDQNGANGFSEDANEEQVVCETILRVPPNTSNSATTQHSEVDKLVNKKDAAKTSESVDDSSDYQKQLGVQGMVCEKDGQRTQEPAKYVEPDKVPATVDGSNLELQEIVLPSGEVVQCYGSSGTDVGSQYFIIPNVGDQNSVVDHEYSVVQADSIPVILQNLDNSHLHLQQPEQLIFITSSSDQVECSETEVANA